MPPIERRVNRYHAGSLSHPSSAGRDWNRTFETKPATIRGGALLIHGLTDAPYSMRAVADVLSREWRVLAVAAHAGARHHPVGPGSIVVEGLARRRPDGRPSREGQHSSGYAAHPRRLFQWRRAGPEVCTSRRSEREGDPRPAKLHPAVADDRRHARRAAGLVDQPARLVPYFEKANWLDVLPEYNPFKYNSFPANAGFQTASLTRALQADLDRMTSSGRLDGVPPMLTFQSIVDATVSTPAVVNLLYDRLPRNGSELVLFDVNHVSGINVFVQARRSIAGRSPVRSAAAVVSARAGDQQLDRDARRGCADDRTGRHGRRAQSSSVSRGLPKCSRSPTSPFHFRPTIRSTASTGPTTIAGLLPIGRLSPRGERAVLTVGTDTLMRLSSNPFFPFVAERVRTVIDGAKPRSAECVTICEIAGDDTPPGHPLRRRRRMDPRAKPAPRGNHSLYSSKTWGPLGIRRTISQGRFVRLRQRGIPASSAKSR